jgi:hypothetical protein
MEFKTEVSSSMVKMTGFAMYILLDRDALILSFNNIVAIAD